MAKSIHEIACEEDTFNQDIADIADEVDNKIRAFLSDLKSQSFDDVESFVEEIHKMIYK